MTMKWHEGPHWTTGYDVHGNQIMVPYVGRGKHSRHSTTNGRPQQHGSRAGSVPNKYKPHQGPRECARRVRQLNLRGSLK